MPKVNARMGVSTSVHERGTYFIHVMFFAMFLAVFAIFAVNNSLING
jgi:hypothetical protein